MTLSLELVEHIAELARLELTDEERSRYRQQLSEILAYFEELQAVNTDDISPTAGMQSATNMLRPDEIIAGLGIEDILRNAPDDTDRQFRVPPVFE